MNSLLLILVSLPLSASEPKLNVTVSYDNVRYTVQSANGFLYYKQDSANLRFPLKSCSKSVTEPLISQIKASLTEKQTDKPSPADDVKITSGQTTRTLARGSALGTWLRDVPRRTAYWYAESQVACRK
jgi:hypothetical protein